jgi:hypothetical protein
MSANTPFCRAAERPPVLPYHLQPFPQELELSLRRLERIALGAQGLAWRYVENADGSVGLGSA